MSGDSRHSDMEDSRAEVTRIYELFRDEHRLIHHIPDDKGSESMATYGGSADACLVDVSRRLKS